MSFIIFISFILSISSIIHNAKSSPSSSAYVYDPNDWVNGYYYPYMKYPPLNAVFYDTNYPNALAVPTIGLSPGAGCKFQEFAPEYVKTNIYHLITLPNDWSADAVAAGKTWPVIVEYAGNYFPVGNYFGYEEGMSLGYSISQGRFIVVGMPYIAADNFNYCAIWWDNTAATVQYAKVNVPRILQKYGGDTTRVLLTGFSRGAIAVSYIGLYDDQIAKLWTAFYAHEHFDGMIDWGTYWSPRQQAKFRLTRLKNRPLLITQNLELTQWMNISFPLQYLPKPYDLTMIDDIDMYKIFGPIPNSMITLTHNDKWLLVCGNCIWGQKLQNWLNRAFRMSPTPTISPTLAKPVSAFPSFSPSTEQPTLTPTKSPTNEPTFRETNRPTETPSYSPTFSPTFAPSYSPSFGPTFTPTFAPTASPSTIAPTTTKPTTIKPVTLKPSVLAVGIPTKPTNKPTLKPSTDKPTLKPSTDKPTLKPSKKPLLRPSTKPSLRPSAKQSLRPTTKPSRKPSSKPTTIVVKFATSSTKLSAKPSSKPTTIAVKLATSSRKPSLKPS